MQRLAISIVTWNHASVIERCLETLKPYIGDTVDVYALDNGSTDTTLEVLKKYSYIHLLQEPVNKGFTGGHNRVWEQIADKGYDYLVLLNPDTVHEMNWVAVLEKFMDSHEEVALAQPKILLAQDKTKINTIGNTLHYLGYSYCKHQGETDTGSTTPFPITIASGAALILRTSFIKEHELFDNNFFAYQEDTDLSLRVHKTGQQVYCVPEAQVLHEYVFSRGKYKWYFLERNRLYLLKKHFPWWYLVLLAPIILTNEFVMLIAAIAGGWFGNKLRSYKDWITLWSTARTYKQTHPPTHASLRPIIKNLTWRLPKPDGSRVPTILLQCLNIYYFLAWTIFRIWLKIARLY